MKKQMINKIMIIILGVTIALFLYSIIGLLFLNVTDNSDYKCYWTTRGYICVFGGDEE